VVKIWWTRLQRFLFPPETDKWLAVLRVGLGLQVITNALFLRGDWHYLFASTGKGLVSRELGEAITAFDSPFIPKLGWLVALGRSINIREETVLSVARACLLCMGFLLLVFLAASQYAWVTVGGMGPICGARRFARLLTSCHRTFLFGSNTRCRSSEFQSF